MTTCHRSQILHLVYRASALPFISIAPTSPTATLEDLKALPSPQYIELNQFKSDYHAGHFRRGVLAILNRHAESVCNQTKIYQGANTFSPLTPEGLEQADRLGASLSDIEINSLFASPMIRTQQTARMHIKHRKASPEIQTLTDLCEVESGILQGWPKHMSQAEVQDFLAHETDPEFRRLFRDKHHITDELVSIVYWNLRRHSEHIEMLARLHGLSTDQYVENLKQITDHLTERPPCGESFTDAKQRMDRLIEHHIDPLQQGVHVFVGHGTSHALTLMGLLNVPLESKSHLSRIKQTNANINIVYREHNSAPWQLLLLNYTP